MSYTAELYQRDPNWDGDIFRRGRPSFVVEGSSEEVKCSTE